MYMQSHTHELENPFYPPSRDVCLFALAYMFRVVALQEQHYFINDSSACADKEATKAPTMQIRLKARLKPFSP